MFKNILYVFQNLYFLASGLLFFSASPPPYKNIRWTPSPTNTITVRCTRRRRRQLPTGRPTDDGRNAQTVRQRMRVARAGGLWAGGPDGVGLAGGHSGTAAPPFRFARERRLGESSPGVCVCVCAPAGDTHTHNRTRARAVW